MAISRGPALDEGYLDNLRRVVEDGGTFVKVDARDIQDSIDVVSVLNPSLFMVPTAGKAGKLYSLVPGDGSSDFTVSRNGTATYFDKDGLLKTAAANEPRFEFDPLTGEYKGLLVEPAATNSFLRSEEFSNNYWSKTGTTVESSNVESIRGDSSVAFLKEDNNNSEHRIEVVIGGSYNQDIEFTLSLYAKAENSKYIQLKTQQQSTGNRAYANFDLQSGEIVTQASAGAFSIRSTSIEHVGDGWYRCILAGQKSGELSNSFFVRIQIADEEKKANASPSYQGDENNGLYIWGAQLEVGSVATSYIPTTGSQVRRPADSITRTNAQDLIGQTEGSVYVEFVSLPYSNNFRRPFHIIGTGSPSYLSYYINPSSTPGTLTLDCKRPGATLPTVNVGTLVSGVNKLLYIYTETSQKTFLNGTLRRTDNFNEITTDWGLGSCLLGYLSTQVLNGSIKIFSTFTNPLSDAEAISLTTL
jgi:hypothetical protein